MWQIFRMYRDDLTPPVWQVTANFTLAFGMLDAVGPENIPAETATDEQVIAVAKGDLKRFVNRPES